jgi:ArsR family transcriptional regulator, cadmium/lead-responsive transcriptional repressor
LPSRADGHGRALDAVFAALADPTRRDVVRHLATAPSTATELAAQVPVSRQAVVKHLSTLERAGLVDAEREGRSVRYRLTPAGFTDVVAWVSDVGAAWDTRLAALQRHVNSRRGRSF